LSASLWARLVLSSIFIFPLGFILGILFPQGLKRLYKFRPNLIPWAWAFNGYMTLVGSLVHC
jgi:hypothetical protein